MRWTWLGRVDYRAAWALQEQLREELLAERGEETLLLCEHPPVITLGKSAKARNVLFTDAELAERGIQVIETSRGGDVTYHGPGQLVGYPIVRVRGVVAHLVGMAQAIIDVAQAMGVRALWRRECPGVWVDGAKLAAFGVHIRKGVAIHGFALNVTTAPQAFAGIVPCGIAGCEVTSLAALGANPPSLEELAAGLASAYAARRGKPPVHVASRAILGG
jgi:lipoyl(octanoyl) transferase